MSRKTDSADEMGDSLRIDLTAGQARKQTVAAACDVLDENKSAAVLDACKFLARMAGGTSVQVGPGKFAELLEAAEERGSLTGQEIVEMLDTEEVPLEYETEWVVGEE